MADDIIFSLDADGEGTISVLDEIDAALSSLADSIAATAESASSFDVLDAAMEELSAMTQQGAADAEALDAALSTVGDEALAASDEMSTLSAMLELLSASVDDLAASLDTADTSLQETGAAAEEAGGMLEGLQEAMGPLMMVGMVAALAGAKLVGMGMSGQKSEALLRGMAGASQADINQLQQSAVDLGVTMDAASAGFYEVESAGYAGSQAITVFDAATKLAEGGQASEADVLSSLTAIMHDYNAKASDATEYTDLMGMAVVRGKQSMSDFASSIGPLASAGENVGLSFKEVASAEATMTQINPHVRQDAQELTSLFKTLSPTMGTVASSAKKLGISFDEAHYNSLDLLDKLEYLSKIAGGTNTAAFAKLTGGVQGSTAAIDLLKNKAEAFKGNLDAMGHAAGTTANAFNQYESTVPAHLDKAGAAISVFATRLMDTLGPKLIPVIDKVTSSISTMANYLISHGDVLNAVLSGLAGVIGGILVTAVVSFVAASWPVLLIIAAIGAAVAGVVYAFEHWTQILHLANQAMQIPAIHMIVQALQSVGSYLVSTFTPVWNQLVSTFNGEVKPAWNSLLSAVRPLFPELKMFGEFMGAILVVDIGIFIGIIGGLMHALASALSGIISIFGGIVSIISGAIKVATGIISFFVDLVTFKWGNLGRDLGVIMDGIGTMFHGIWEVIKGIFQTAFGAIIGFVAGFIQTITGFFTQLWDDLVGHSIIPDMINGIVSWFEQLPGRSMTFVENLIGRLVSRLGSLGSQALTWGADMLAGFISGIESKVGSLFSTIGGIASGIASHLHFSKPETGALADADTWMPDMIALFIQGISANQNKLKAAMAGLSTQMAQGIQAPGGSIAPAGGAGTLAPLGGSSATPLLAGILAALQQQNRPSAPQTPPGITMYNTNSLYGVQNINDLYNSLNTMSGYNYENGARGTF
jgi:TP901 family phage tail tape measure protein